MKRYVLAIDQGTTSCRAILFDKQGRMVVKSVKEFKQIYPRAGWVEHDPLEIINCQLDVIRRVISENKISPDTIDSIGITNQRETVVVWNKETGIPMYNAIVWQCRRTSDDCEELKKQGLKELVQRKTGLVIDAYFSGTKIKWILDNVPEARKLANEGKLLAGTVDSWLIWNITGRKSHVTDYTNASRTMIFNIDTLKWDNELLEILRIPESILPNVKNSSDNFGTLDENILGVEIPITGVAGDQQAALFGQGCFEKGMAKNTYGTGCFMLLNTGKERITSNNNLLTTLACGMDGRVQYALEGSVFIAGSVVKWLRDDLKLISNAVETDSIAASISDTRGVYFVPAFVGLGAPYWDMYARGAIVGLTQGAGRKEIIRAALEAIAYQTKDVLTAMELDSGIKLSELRVDGGASSNEFLMQFQADILGVDVVRPSNIEATAQGAAMLAGLKTGFWMDSDLKTWALDKVTFHSKMIEDDRVVKYNGWKDAVKRCR